MIMTYKSYFNFYMICQTTIYPNTHWKFIPIFLYAKKIVFISLLIFVHLYTYHIHNFTHILVLREWIIFFLDFST